MTFYTHQFFKKYEVLILPHVNWWENELIQYLENNLALSHGTIYLQIQDLEAISR